MQKQIFSTMVKQKVKIFSLCHMQFRGISPQRIWNFLYLVEEKCSSSSEKKICVLNTMMLKTIWGVFNMSKFLSMFDRVKS
jgi:hypothetical protein